jgi:single-strand DNA-binding protein
MQMLDINKATLFENLDKNLQVQRQERGAVVAKFSLAITKNYTYKEGNFKSETVWHIIVSWRKLADKYMRKGDIIYLEGKIKNRSYEDKEGRKKNVTEILADNYILLDRTTDKTEINESFK